MSIIKFTSISVDNETYENKNQEISTIQIENNDVIKLLKKISNSSTENEKNNLAEQINNLILIYDGSEFHSLINIEICDQLNKLIKDGNSVFEKQILKIVGTIAEQGAQYAEWFNKNIFQSIFKQSGLALKVEQILMKNIEQEKQDIKAGKFYSQFITELVLIISFINKRNQLQINLQQICGEIYIYQIEFLRGLLNFQYKQEKQEFEQSQNSKSNIENKLNDMIRFQFALKGLVEEIYNRQFFTKQHMIYDQLVNILQLQCFSQVNSIQNFSLKDYSSYKQIECSIISTLSILGWDGKCRQYLSQNEFFQQYLISNIINFANINLEYKQQLYKIHNLFSILEQQSHFTSTQQVIIEIISLFNFTLSVNHQLLQQSQSATIFETALIKLTQFGRKVPFDQKQLKEVVYIRKLSIQCLNAISFQGDQKELKQLIKNLKIIKVFIEGFCTAGGSEEENNKIIKISLRSFSQIIGQLCLDYSWRQSMPKLTKEINENCEEFGGVEEVDSNLFHSEDQDDGIKIDAELAIVKLVNVTKISI